MKGGVSRSFFSSPKNWAPTAPSTTGGRSLLQERYVFLERPAQLHCFGAELWPYCANLSLKRTRLSWVVLVDITRQVKQDWRKEGQHEVVEKKIASECPERCHPIVVAVKRLEKVL